MYGRKPIGETDPTLLGDMNRVNLREGSETSTAKERLTEMIRNLETEPAVLDLADLARRLQTMMYDPPSWIKVDELQHVLENFPDALKSGQRMILREFFGWSKDDPDSFEGLRTDVALVSSEVANAMDAFFAKDPDDREDDLNEEEVFDINQPLILLPAKGQKSLGEVSKTKDKDRFPKDVLNMPFVVHIKVKETDTEHLAEEIEKLGVQGI